MILAQAPYDFYFERDGDPLDAGYIYFGQPFQNPETNPVQMYWDADGTLPAAQPIRTSNGYIVRNGTPANVFAAGDYSITVRNRKREIVYYIQSIVAARAASASSLLFVQAGAGAVIRDAQGKMRETVSITDFAANGVSGARVDPTGVLDSTLGIQAALNSGATNVFVPKGQYKVTPQSNAQALTLPDGVTLYGDAGGSELLMVTDPANLPNDVVWWDVILSTGAKTNWSCVRNIRIRHSGGSRINCASIAVRDGASKVAIYGNDIADSISSGIVIEGLVATPQETYCLVEGNQVSNCVRHAVYLSGARYNRVIANTFTTTRLESVVNRNAPDNDLLENVIVGDGVNYPVHAIGLAAPPSGTYDVKRFRVQGNRMFNIPGAGFYGQGNGSMISDSDISENYMNCGLVGTSHVMAFYRARRCRINNNNIHGGRNRGISLYGCQLNDVVGNVIQNVNSAGGSIGAIVAADYTDPADASVNYSTDNFFDRNRIVDDRGTALHFYGIQFLANCHPNKIGQNHIAGLLSSKYIAADSWSNFYLPEGDKFDGYYNNLPAGATASVLIPQGGEAVDSVTMSTGWLRSLTVTTSAAITSGTIQISLMVNGVSLVSVNLVGNGALTTAAVYFGPEVQNIDLGAKLSFRLTGTSIVTGAPVDVFAQAKLAAL